MVNKVEKSFGGRDFQFMSEEDLPVASKSVSTNNNNNESFELLMTKQNFKQTSVWYWQTSIG